ncbi:MAG: hypothetical protein HC820_10250 [Hydrococcus sp. RM1_1_31]|nr:hypothetical protein [Hydrococcus sp. RM1_1_31]
MRLTQKPCFNTKLAFPMLGRTRTQSSTLTKNIKLSRTSELVGLAFKLQPRENATVFPQYITGLHGWFLDQVRQLDPKLSQVLHDDQDEKAFTLSPLDGLADTAGHRLQLYAQQTYHWTVTAISKPLVDWIRDWLKVLPPDH